MNLAIIILAAGQGTRMRSRLPKVLHRLCGKPMVDYVVDAALSLQPSQIIGVVDGPGPVAEYLSGKSIALAYQPVRQGTGDAVRQGLAIADAEVTHFLILNGDTPFLHVSTLRNMVLPSNAELRLLAADVKSPTGYGRIFEEGPLVRIVEEADATFEEKQNQRINAGVYFTSKKFLESNVPLLTNNNRQKEYYLTDLALFSRHTEVVLAKDEQEIAGINHREQLAAGEAFLRKQKNKALMLSGVTMQDPACTYVDWDVQVGSDSTLYAGVVLEGATSIGPNCTVYGGVRIADSQIGEGCTILDGSLLQKAIVGSNSQVGPMAHLRPGTVLGAHCKIGNFVELKSALVGDESKASHLSYLGDVEIGQNVNIGCGTITCNYDGVNKHRTVIEDSVFVGSDTQLVAPVRVGKGAIIASGTTVTEDVPSEALVLTRAALVVKKQYAQRYWSQRREQAKEKPRSIHTKEGGS